MRMSHYEGVEELLVRQQINDLNQQKIKINKELNECLTYKLPLLYKEHSRLYTSQILLSDYEFKIERQKKETQKLNNIISFLLTQNARQKFFKIFFSF
jgi:hypothetical protein